jgi:hypothetical protein
VDERTNNEFSIKVKGRLTAAPLLKPYGNYTVMMDLNKKQNTALALCSERISLILDPVSLVEIRNLVESIDKDFTILAKENKIPPFARGLETKLEETEEGVILHTSNKLTIHRNDIRLYKSCSLDPGLTTHHPRDTMKLFHFPTDWGVMTKPNETFQEGDLVEVILVPVSYKVKTDYSGLNIACRLLKKMASSAPLPPPFKKTKYKF